MALCSVSGKNMTVISYKDNLGTWQVYLEYVIDADGFSKLPTEYIYFVNGISRALVTKIEMPVQMLESGVYVYRVLEAGTTLIPVASNWQSCLIFN